MKGKARQITPQNLARLARARRRYGITLAAVAAEAVKTSRRGSVGIPTVSRALSGDTKSANVVATLKRLIAEAKAQAAPGEQQGAA